MRKKLSLPQSETDLVQLEQLLTITAAAKMLNVSRPTLYKLITEQGLPVIRLNRSMRIVPTSLRQWMTARQQS